MTAQRTWRPKGFKNPLVKYPTVLGNRTARDSVAFAESSAEGQKEMILESERLVPLGHVLTGRL